MRRAKFLTLALAATLPACAQAQAQGWEWGAVLDVSALSKAYPLGARDKGLGLGHSDFTLSGPLGSLFEARLTAAAHTHERKLELDLEEASLTTRTLPFGLQLKAGRFASQLGYLNEQHPHADDFIERPLPYRAFFGQHWFDDGVRLNWVAPTAQYLRLGVEAFHGKQLVREVIGKRRPGVLVFSAKTGADLDRSLSWQAGLAYLDNRREAAVEGDHDHDDHEHSHEHEHSHAHGAAFSGRRGYVADLTLKWAPDGNAKNQQLRLNYEYVRIDRPNRFARASDRHEGDYLNLVYRFHPAWELGASAARIKVRIPHDDHFHPGRMREFSAMLAYKPSHLQSWRLQASRVSGARGFGEVPRTYVGVQMVLSFGQHPAHSF